MSLKSNPSNCCGIKTDACPNNPIADVLNATIVTSCGTYVTELAFDDSESTSTTWTWKGRVDVECKTIMGACVSCQLTVRAKTNAQTWYLQLNNEQRPTGTSCTAFMLVYLFDGLGVVCTSCNDTFDVTVVE